jgi:hypothetical protein
MGISTADKKQFIEDSQDREAPFMRQVEAMYGKVRDEVTNDSLSFFNSRRYLNAPNENARARAAKNDKGIKAISGKIAKLGADTLKLLNTSCITHYNSEGIILTNLWNDNTPEFFTMTFEKADKKKQKQILDEWYLGFQYPEWQKSATKTASDAWQRSSRGVMSSNVRRPNKVSPSMQLTAHLRQTITTMESKAKSLMDGALSETVRILIVDTQQAVLKGEIALAKALQKRVAEWQR